MFFIPCSKSVRSNTLLFKTRVYIVAYCWLFDRFKHSVISNDCHMLSQKYRVVIIRGVITAGQSSLDFSFILMI
jgi:hypothetical protein